MDILTESLQDCVADCDELLYLTSDAIAKLTLFKRDIKKIKKHLLEDSYALLIKETNTLIAHYETEDITIRNTNNEIASFQPSNQLLDRTTTTIMRSREFLRIHQVQTGALITSTDWQSPSYAHTVRSQAGRQINAIYATVNDYKRDRHDDASRFERAFVKEYVDNWIKFPVYAYATASGMAAFTTILNYLLLEKKAKGKVLIGNSIWFQNKGLLISAFGNQIISVDESDTPEIIHIIKNERPSMVIFDSLTNAADVSVPNLPEIIQAVVKNAKEETYIVIDNTCLACTFQPLKYVFAKRTPVRLLVFESLNKYHQFGMDRVTGGIIWCYGAGTMQISDYRAHLGTNIPDASIASLPSPNRKRLNARLARHSRNTTIIVERLQLWVNTHQKNPIDSISYPESASHGSFFVVRFKEFYQSVPYYNSFVSKIMHEARKRKIDMIGGTSFGLNTTRIYLTSLKSKPSAPFVRISVGTEHLAQIELIISVFIKVFSSL